MRIVKEEFYDYGQLERKVPYLNDEKHGTEKWFYPNGQIRLKTPYVNGKEHGIIEWFYLNGQLMDKKPYIEGKKHGIERWFYPNGQLMHETPYVEDKPHGIAKWFYKSGDLEREIKHQSHECKHTLCQEIGFEFLAIGCKERTISEWKEFFYNSDEVIETPRDNEEFKKIQEAFEEFVND